MIGAEARQFVVRGPACGERKRFGSGIGGMRKAARRNGASDIEGCQVTPRFAPEYAEALEKRRPVGDRRE
jgi:hypothetical protein